MPETDCVRGGRIAGGRSMSIWHAAPWVFRANSVLIRCRRYIVWHYADTRSGYADTCIRRYGRLEMAPSNPRGENVRPNDPGARVPAALLPDELKNISSCRKQTSCRTTANAHTTFSRYGLANLNSCRKHRNKLFGVHLTFVVRQVHVRYHSNTFSRLHDFLQSTRYIQ